MHEILAESVYIYLRLPAPPPFKDCWEIGSGDDDYEDGYGFLTKTKKFDEWQKQVALLCYESAPLDEQNCVFGVQIRAHVDDDLMDINQVINPTIDVLAAMGITAGHKYLTYAAVRRAPELDDYALTYPNFTKLPKNYMDVFIVRPTSNKTKAVIFTSIDVAWANNHLSKHGKRIVFDDQAAFAGGTSQV